MEAVIFAGLPGAGKTSFYKAQFFSTHVRISLDLLKTRHREERMLQVCLDTDQRFVIDNNNPSKAERAKYIAATRAARVRYTIVGYYFASSIEACVRRNADRQGVERVPDVAVYSAAKRLALPTMDEGFDKLFSVRLSDAGFTVEDWTDEV